MSNLLIVTVPGWVSPADAACILERLLTGQAYVQSNDQASPPVRWFSEPTTCPEVGCRININMTDQTGKLTRRAFFASASGDAFGRRSLTVHDGPFWREVMGRLLDVVGGSLRNEYSAAPELVVRPSRARLDLGADQNWHWLWRRVDRYRFAEPQRLYALATGD